MWKSAFYADVLCENYHETVEKRSLADLSNNEMIILLGKVRLYLEHYTIVKRKRNSEEASNKLSFFRRLNRILTIEYDSRASA